jgi:hypothetical protein
MMISGASIGISLICVVATNVIGVYVTPDAIGPDYLRLIQVGVLLAFAMIVIRSAAKYR